MEQLPTFITTQSPKTPMRQVESDLCREELSIMRPLQTPRGLPGTQLQRERDFGSGMRHIQVAAAEGGPWRRYSGSLGRRRRGVPPASWQTVCRPGAFIPSPGPERTRGMLRVTAAGWGPPDPGVSPAGSCPRVARQNPHHHPASRCHRRMTPHVPIKHQGKYVRDVCRLSSSK